MKKLLIMILLSIVIIAGCQSNSTNNPSSTVKSATMESHVNNYITVENISLNDLLEKINVKEDFAFIVTRSKECGPCKSLDEDLKTFESEGSVVYRIDLDTLTEAQEIELIDKLRDPLYSENRLDGYPVIYYYSKKKNIYLQPVYGGQSGNNGLLRQRFPRSKVNN